MSIFLSRSTYSFLTQKTSNILIYLFVYYPCFLFLSQMASTIFVFIYLFSYLFSLFPFFSPRWPALYLFIYLFIYFFLSLSLSAVEMEEVKKVCSVLNSLYNEKVKASKPKSKKKGGGKAKLNVGQGAIAVSSCAFESLFFEGKV